MDAVTLHQRNSISHVRNSYLDYGSGGHCSIAKTYPQMQNQGAASTCSG